VQNAGADRALAAEALLRFAKVEQAYYGSTTGRILEIVGMAIADFRNQMVVFDGLARARTNQHLLQHPSRPCRDTNCCYVSVLAVLRKMKDSSNRTNLANCYDRPTQNGWAETPCHALDQPAALEAVLEDARHHGFIR
jgi:hypothetical protein